MGTGRGSNKLTFMAFYDHSANSQSQADPSRFRRNERFKNSVSLFWINSRSGVLHRYNNGSIPMMLSTQPQYPAIVLDAIHCFDGVVHQIDEDLLQLTPVAHNER